jgi:hypothetical protein
MSDDPSLADLQRPLAVITERVNDAKTHGAVREDRLKKEIGDLEEQNSRLREHIVVLDKFIKKLSLVHSQLSAAPSYKLAKADVDEIVRLVTVI